MKRKILLLIILIIGQFTFINAQTMPGFIYQGVAFDQNGDVIKNTEIRLRFAIVDDPANQVMYSEMHKTDASSTGTFAVSIGDGNPISGNFNTLDWRKKDLVLIIQIDIEGNGQFVELGTTEFHSVPYAVHAQTVADKDDDDADPQNEIQLLSFNSQNNSLSISGGNAITIPTGGTDADADPSNELQTLSFDANTNELSISDGNKVSIPTGGTDADVDPSNESQTLAISNDSLYISSGNGVKLPSSSSGSMLIDGDGDTKVELLENGLSDIVGFTVDNNQILGIDQKSIQFFNNNDNTFVGGGAGSAFNTGNGNTFYGKDAGLNLQSGTSNVFIGNGAGASHSSGDKNTYIGALAGPSTTSGSSNVFIGNQAGQAYSGSNKLIIENSASTSPLIYGEFDNDRLELNAKVGIGISPATQFHVNSQSTEAARFESIDNTIVSFYKNGNQKGFVQTLFDDFVFGKTVGPAGSVKLFNQGHYLSLENDGDVAIGTSSPVSSKLYVESSGTSPVISSNVVFMGTSDVKAIEGISKPADGYGYGGYFEGGWRGVYGKAEGGSSPRPFSTKNKSYKLFIYVLNIQYV